jgi:hypothetical protein
MTEAGEREKVVVVPAQLSPRAASLIDRVKSDFGLTQKAAVEMGIEFLGSLPPTVLREVFRRGGDPAAELVRIKQAEVAGAAADADSVDKALAVIRYHLGIVENLAHSRKHQGKGGK